MDRQIPKHVTENSYGTFEVHIKDELTAGSELEWRVGIRAGQDGTKKGTQIRITVPAYQHQRSEEYLQTDDYWRPNYIYIQQPGSMIIAEVHVENVPSEFQHILRWKDSSRVAVIDFYEDLEAGMMIEVRFGGIDRPWLAGKGQPSFVGSGSFKRKGTYLEYDVEIKSPDQTTYDRLDIFPKVKVLPEKEDSMVLYAPSVVRPEEVIEVTAVILDRYHNPIFDCDMTGIDLVITDLEKDSIYKGHEEVRPLESEGKWQIRLPEQGVFCLSMKGKDMSADTKNISLAGTNISAHDTIIVCSESMDKLYWGDTHIHSNLTANIRDNDGGADPDDVYTYAKEVSHLDFMVLSEQTFEFNDNRALNVDEPTWKAIGDYAEKHLEEGKFVTFPGIELHSKRGDTVLVFGDKLEGYGYPGGSVKEVQDAWQHYEGKPLITIPHLHRYAGGRPSKDQQEKKFSGFSLDNWKATDNHVECLAEVYSAQWGRFEHKGNPMLLKARDNVDGNTLNDFLMSGKKWGVTANSDGHDGNPGYGGVTGVYAPENTRAGIFDAMKQRKTIASTHERGVIDFKLDEEGVLQYLAAVPSDIDFIELVADGQVIKSIAGIGRLMSGDIDKSLIKDKTYVYMRVQLKNRHILWTSPLWLMEH